jgi:hypothetical protein
VVSSSILSETQTLNSDWQWRDWEGLPYLTCSLLQQWQHGFFTQQFYPRIPEDLVIILNSDATVHRVKQIHGNQILTPTEILAAKNQADLPESLPGADGILSDRVSQAVWVASADCNPVLIGDVVTGRVAAIHAGWRGTAQRIVVEAIARLVARGSSLENLRIAMGPAISGEVYQVTEYVAAEVGTSIIASEEAKTTEEMLTALQQLPDSPILADPEPGRVRLDVRRVNAIQLEQLGIDREQIAIAPYCTYQQPDYFFSYRRTNEKQVQWSGIISHQPK